MAVGTSSIERGLGTEDLAAFVEARRERFGGRAASGRRALAEAVNQRLGLGLITERSIQKIETGHRVEAHILRPVEIELGLRPEPPLDPPTDQHPGEWCEDL